MVDVDKITCDGCHKELNDAYPEDTEYTRRLMIKFKGWNLCTACAKNRYITERIEYYKNMISTFSKLVNNCAFDYDGIESDAIVIAFFKEHRQLQNDMIASLHRILGNIGKGSGDINYEDPRNQWALSWCKKVSEIY